MLPSVFFLLFGISYLNIRSRYKWWYLIVLGNLVLIGITSIYLVIGAFSVRIRTKISPALSVFWVLFWGFIWGIMMIIFLSLIPINSNFLSFNLNNLLTTQILFFGVLLALFGSILPYGLIMISNKFRVEASIQSILGLGEPIAAVILGYLILTEPITKWYLLGGFFLLLAIINILSTANKTRLAN